MADSYADKDYADQYFESRGLSKAWDKVDNKEAALVRGSDYIDWYYRIQSPCGWQSQFVGAKTAGRSQSREWPRRNAVDYNGDEIDSGEVPDEVKRASLEAALREGESPGCLLPDFNPSNWVTQEKVGPLSVTYGKTSEAGSSQGLPNTPSIPIIDYILAPVLRNECAVYNKPAIYLV